MVVRGWLTGNRLEAAGIKASNFQAHECVSRAIPTQPDGFIVIIPLATTARQNKQEKMQTTDPKIVTRFNALIIEDKRESALLSPCRFAADGECKPY